MGSGEAMDPFCDCCGSTGHCSGIPNGYGNQRYQHFRKLAIHMRAKKIPYEYVGRDPWTERMQGGMTGAYAGPSAFGP